MNYLQLCDDIAFPFDEKFASISFRSSSPGTKRKVKLKMWTKTEEIPILENSETQLKREKKGSKEIKEKFFHFDLYTLEFFWQFKPNFSQ